MTAATVSGTWPGKDLALFQIDLPTMYCFRFCLSISILTCYPGKVYGGFRRASGALVTASDLGNTTFHYQEYNVTTAPSSAINRVSLYQAAADPTGSPFELKVCATAKDNGFSDESYCVCDQSCTNSGTGSYVNLNAYL